MGIAWLALAVLGLSDSGPTSFTKVVLDKRFISEGVAVGDVNRDGRLDVMAGNVWFQAPKWEAHEIAPVPILDPKTQYSNCFHCWAADLNRDGWVDQIVIGMPGEKAVWRENPKGKAEPWKEHPIWHSACNESPLYADLFGNGKKVLIMGTDDKYLAWFEPAKDPYTEWVCHWVSELKGPGSQRYSHGLGVGDLDGDGKQEIITTGGYYKGSQSGNWTLVKADLGPDCAQMLSVFNRNGSRSTILTTSAHARGFWLFHPIGASGFQRYVVDDKISETHSAALMRIGKKNVLNLITGKRKWAHPPGVDVGSEEPSVLIRYELTDTGEFQLWVPRVIDQESGVGTQFVVQDMNRDGLQDIVISNKNGVFVFFQKK